MDRHNGYQRRHCERVEQLDRYEYRVRQFQCSCEGCSKVLHQTHDYIRYGNLCWVCWRHNQRLGVVLVSL